MTSIIAKRLCLHKNLANQTQKNQDLKLKMGRLQALANLGTTTCMIAHEINNLLTPLSNYAELALNNPDTVDLPVNEPLLASREAIAIKKGEQELLNFLNAWVTAKQADLWIATTRDYWFETLEWAEDVAR